MWSKYVIKFKDGHIEYLDEVRKVYDSDESQFITFQFSYIGNDEFYHVSKNEIESYGKVDIVERFVTRKILKK